MFDIANISDQLLSGSEYDKTWYKSQESSVYITDALTIRTLRYFPELLDQVCESLDRNPEFMDELGKIIAKDGTEIKRLSIGSFLMMDQALETFFTNSMRMSRKSSRQCFPGRIVQEYSEIPYLWDISGKGSITRMRPCWELNLKVTFRSFRHILKT